MDEKRYVFSTQETIHYRFPTHVNDLVMDRADAATSEVFVVVLEPGEAPPLHRHDDTEQVFYIMEGTGILQIGEGGPTYPVKLGDVVRIPPHVWHKILCDGPRTLKYLSVDCFVGHKPREEPTWDSHVRAICKLNGWDYDQVKKPR